MPYDDAETRSDAPERRPETRPGEKPSETRPSESRPPENRDGASKPSEEDASKQRERDADRARQRRRPWVIGALVVLALIAITGGVLWWLANKDIVGTDDAYTDGRAVTMAPAGQRLRHRSSRSTTTSSCTPATC